MYVPLVSSAKAPPSLSQSLPLPTVPPHAPLHNHTQDRRALEYTLYDKELKQARDDLSKAEDARLREIERADDVHRQLHETRDALHQVEASLKILSEQLHRKDKDRNAVEKEREGLIAEREKTANEERTLREKLESDETRQMELKAKLVKVEKEVAQVEKDLAEKVEPEWKGAKKVSGWW